MIQKKVVDPTSRKPRSIEGSIRPFSSGRLPYSLLPLLLGMFVVVLALDEQGITSLIAGILNQDGYSIWSHGLGSMFLANLMNNIPKSVLFEEVFLSAPYESLAPYAVILSSNLAAYLTPLRGPCWAHVPPEGQGRRDPSHLPSLHEGRPHGRGARPPHRATRPPGRGVPLRLGRGLNSGFSGIAFRIFWS